MPECRTGGCVEHVKRAGTRCPTCARRHKTILQKRRRTLQRAQQKTIEDDARIDLDADDAESIHHHLNATLHALSKLRSDVNSRQQPARLAGNKTPVNVVPAARIVADVTRIEKAIQPAANLLKRWNAINTE